MENELRGVRSTRTIADPGCEEQPSESVSTTPRKRAPDEPVLKETVLVPCPAVSTPFVIPQLYVDPGWKRDIPYQSLLKQFLAERLQLELSKGAGA